MVAALFYFLLLVAPHVGSVGEVCLAVAQVIAADGKNPPVYGSHAEDASLMVTFAYHESRFNPTAVGLGGAYGAWQFERRAPRSTLAQAKAWLWVLREGKRLCPDHPAAIVGWGRCHGKDALTGRDVGELAGEREDEARASLRAAIDGG